MLLGNVKKIFSRIDYRCRYLAAHTATSDLITVNPNRDAFAEVGADYDWSRDFKLQYFQDETFQDLKNENFFLGTTFYAQGIKIK